MLSVLDQIIEQAKSYNFDFGVIQSNHKLTNKKALLQLASNSTLVKRDLPFFDLIIIDEVHYINKKLHTLLMTTESRVIGLSATPFNQGLHKIFTKLLNLSTARELTDLGILAPLKIISGHKIDTGKLSKDSYGEYSSSSIEAATNEILGDAITLWKEHANNRQTLVFASRITHAENIAEEFNSAGIKAAVYCAGTPNKERATILQQFKAGDIKVLCSVQAISVGFDVPQAAVMIDLRPLRKSLSTLVQSIGRILRAAPGKENALLLDCTGNIIRFADDYVDLFNNGVVGFNMAVDKDTKIRDKPTPEEKLYKGITQIKAGVEFNEIDIFKQVPLWVELSNYVLSVRDRIGFDIVRAYKKALALHKNITGSFPKYGTPLEPTPDNYVGKKTLEKIKELATQWRLNKSYTFRK